ncbi:hypothetical protein J5X84_39655 [Streptosporangiaceae bacterium NEAU-GS5]|nr:hypothetical protein [Streptosporangiaceae bacterium NEAU-GS5]
MGLVLSRGPDVVPAHSGTPTVAPVSPSPSPPRPNKLVPKESGGATKTIKVTFPDGYAARIAYPSDVGLAHLGVRPYAVAIIGTRLRQFYAPAGGEAEVAAGGPMIRRLTGNVTLWPGLPGPAAAVPPPVLLFAFKNWRIAMPDVELQMSFEERVGVARALHARVTTDGYLILSADPPVRLGTPRDIMSGMMLAPELWFGGLPDLMVVLVHTLNCRTDLPRLEGMAEHAFVEDAARAGEEGRMVGAEFADACASKDVYVAAGGPGDLVRHIRDTVRVKE